MSINSVGYVGGTLTFYIGHGLVKLKFVYRWIEKMKQSGASGFRIDKNKFRHDIITQLYIFLL